jgi:hypothetical protein
MTKNHAISLFFVVAVVYSQHHRYKMTPMLIGLIAFITLMVLLLIVVVAMSGSSSEQAPPLPTFTAPTPPAPLPAAATKPLPAPVGAPTVPPSAPAAPAPAPAPSVLSSLASLYYSWSAQRNDSCMTPSQSCGNQPALYVNSGTVGKVSPVKTDVASVPLYSTWSSTRQDQCLAPYQNCYLTASDAAADSYGHKKNNVYPAGDVVGWVAPNATGEFTQPLYASWSAGRNDMCLSPYPNCYLTQAASDADIYGHKKNSVYNAGAVIGYAAPA